MRYSPIYLSNMGSQLRVQHSSPTLTLLLLFFLHHCWEADPRSEGAGELIRSRSDAICQSQPGGGGARRGGVRTLTDPRLSLPSLSKQTNWPLRDGPTCGQTEDGLKNTNTVRHCGVDSRRACLTTVTVIFFFYLLTFSGSPSTNEKH